MHAPGAKLLRVCQRFHERDSFSGAEFLPYKMLHNIKLVKYLGARSLGKLNKLENTPSCVPYMLQAPTLCAHSLYQSCKMTLEQSPLYVSALKHHGYNCFQTKLPPPRFLMKQRFWQFSSKQSM